MNETDYNTVYAFAEFSMSKTIRFWLLLCFDIPALICTLVLLSHLLFKRTSRQKLHNHIILVLLLIALIAQLIDIPFYILTMQLNHVWLSIPFFCDLWVFVNVGLFDMTAAIMAWLAIERYIYIFHYRLFHTRRNRILFHFLPLFLIIIYECIFYFIVIFFPSCEKIYDYTEPWCGYPCYYDDVIIATYDTIVNCICPILLIIIFNLMLNIRFIRQKRRINWRKNRKLILQSSSICLLFLIFFLPYLILFTAHSHGLPLDVLAELELYLYFFNYFIVLLLPYVCLISMVNVWKRDHRLSPTINGT